MRCEKCGNGIETILIRLYDANGVQVLCPNCVAINLCGGKIHLENDSHFVDEISGKPDAVLFESGGERYVLEAETMLRLLAHHLKPEEYLALIKTHSPNEYMIHDDFYSEDGIALQPTI